MAEVTYNGLTLSYVKTERAEFEPVMDELAGVDVLYTRVAITVTCVVTANADPWQSGETAAATLARIEHLLGTPRRGFQYKVGGTTLVKVGATDTTVPVRDVKNGPNTRVGVVKVAGAESLYVSFAVETFITDCPESGNGTAGQGIGSGVGSGGPEYVSHRWGETIELNELAYSKRTRSGRIVARADLIANADQLRRLVTPALEPDFKRLSSKYILQADGRVLNYEFVDEETYLNPPKPAAKAEGTMSVSTADGAVFFAEVSLRLQGAKPTDKAVLMKLAVTVAMAKLELAGPIKSSKGTFPVMGTLQEDMYSNSVSVRFRAMVQPAKARLTAGDGSASLSTGGGGDGGIVGGGLNIARGQQLGQARAGRTAARSDGIRPGVSAPDTFDWLKVPTEYGDAIQFDPGSRGSAGLLMIAAALQDPCLRQAVLRTLDQGANDATDAGTTVAATIKIQSFVPDYADYRSSPETDGAYELYTVDDRVHRREHKFSVPVGKKDANAAVIQTAAPTAVRRVEWRAIKIGGPPKVPAPVLRDTNWTLVDQQLQPEQVEPIADGSILRFTISGCYDYVATDVRKVKATASVPPWVDAAAWQVAQQPALYTDGIIEPAQASLTTGQVSQLSGILFASGGNLTALAGFGTTDQPF